MRVRVYGGVTSVVQNLVSTNKSVFYSFSNRFFLLSLRGVRDENSFLTFFINATLLLRENPIGRKTIYR